MQTYETTLGKFESPLTMITKSIMQPFTIKAGTKRDKEGRRLEESRFSREEIRIKRKEAAALRKEQEAKRRKFKRAAYDNMRAIRSAVSAFNVRYGKIAQKADLQGFPLDDIADLPGLISQVMGGTASIRVTDEFVALEQAKLDTDGFLWVVNESNRRLDLFTKRMRERVDYEQEQAELARHKNMLLEIAARDAQIADEREAFRAAADKGKADLALLNEIKAEIARERAALKKETDLVVSARRQLGLAQ